MKQSKKPYTFPIEKKLADIEWNLQLLQTSVTTTHTSIATMKSMLKGNVVLPTTNVLERLVSRL
jgi:hypothetical protein